MGEPKITARILPDGVVTIINGFNCEELGKKTARKIARMIQKCGHPNANCVDLRFLNFRCSADCRFPVRLERFAEKWSRHAEYEPEVNAQCMFYLSQPRCTLRISASGKVILLCEGKEDALEALRRVYPLLREFSR